MNDLLFFFWVILLEPDRLSGPGEVYFYESSEACESVRNLVESTADLPGFRIADRCIQIPRFDDEDGHPL